MSTTPPLTRRARGKQDKLQRITAAAQQLFREKGFDQTATHEIAERADVGRGTIFLYASTKEDLLLLAFVGELSMVVEDARRAIDWTAPFIDQVYGFFSDMFAYHRPDPELAKHLIREINILRNPELEPLIRQVPIREVLQEIFDRAVTAGQVRAELDFDAVSGLLFGSYWHCLRGWAAGFDHARFEVRLRAMLEILVEGLARRD